MSQEERPRHELAVQVAVAVAAGAASLQSPAAGAIATGLSPLALSGLRRISEAIRTRRLEHAAETIMDAADAFGAKTPEEFVEFVETAVSDSEHQELLARTLIIGQDTAMRDKRRALGRALASAASDTGTKVDDELLFIRILADLDEAPVRLLRLMSTVPEHLVGYENVRQWYPWSIGQTDPGLADSAWALLHLLEQNGLVWSSGEYHTPAGGMQPEYQITPYGEWFLRRLAEPENAEQ